MNPLERQLAILLKDAPGAPPITLDADTLVAAARPRRRYVAPLIAAAVVLAIAIPVAVRLNQGSSAAAPTTGPPAASQLRPQPVDPHQAAIRTAETIIAAAPVLPGATQHDRPPLPALDQPSTTLGAQYVQRTRFWTAPGAVAAAIFYLKSHPPNGMRPSGSGSAGGTGVPATQTLDFQADEFRTLQYTVVAYHSGVAVRADAQVLWAPRRSPADTVPASVSSVDVTVTRQNPQLHQEAPTVRRTLTGARARALADFVNRLPRAVPTAYVSCPALLGGEEQYDRLVFHSPGPTASVMVNLAGCASTTFQVGSRKPIQLSRTYVGAVEQVDHMILNALALPTDYGH
jgi:hypothetical protein